MKYRIIKEITAKNLKEALRKEAKAEVKEIEPVEETDEKFGF